MSWQLDLISKVLLNGAMACVFVYYARLIAGGGRQRSDLVVAACLAGFMVVRQYLLPHGYALFALLLYAVMFAILLGAYHIPLRQALLCTILFYFCSRYVNQTIAWTTYRLTGYDYINDGTSFAVRLLACACFAGTVFATVRILRPHLVRIRQTHVSRGELAYLLVLCAPLVYFNHARFIADTPAYELPVMIVASRVAVSLCVVLLIVGFFTMKAMAQERQERMRVEELMRHQRDQLALKREYSDFILSKCHDLKKQLSLVSGQSERDLINSHMHELLDAANRYDLIFETGNASLDALLSEKAGICHDRGIEFVCILDGAIFDFVDPLDVVSLFGNALDNAVEACEKVAEPERRRITLKGTREGSMTCVVVSNPCNEVPRMESGIPKTTKQGLGHGFGVRNIRQVAEKYGGFMHIEANGDRYVLTVLLQG